MTGYVYIITNKRHTVLYTGVTSQLYARILKHRNKHYTKSFSARYNVNKLVYYEVYNSITKAIAREKQLKAGSRKQKVGLIDKFNPRWLDLLNNLSPNE